MDVSIAVSLIRGQMGTVVERAVNGAVEAVLAEMLKVVGVKFEELKAQVVLMKRDVAALQSEKALREKENDNIRAKLRYTELKLKYYRQGVEEELQQRASASALVHVQPPSFPRTRRDGAAADASLSAPTRSNQVPECTASQSWRAVRVRCSSDVASFDSSEPLLPVSLAVDPPAESVDVCNRPLKDALRCERSREASGRDVNQQGEEWPVTLLPHSEGVEALVAPPPLRALPLEAGQRPVASSPSSRGSAQAHSPTLPPSAPQVKQEEEEEEEELICIKEEPEEERDVMAALLQPARRPEFQGQRSGMERSRLPAAQSHHPAAVGSGGSSSFPGPQLAAFPPGDPTRLGVCPWTKDLSLYEEYRLRRNELRRRNISRRRELEKTLPQPLLADLVRERREKTRLRVARWRAKRKLQACLDQAHGGAAALSQTAFPVGSQQLTAPGGALQSSSFLSNALPGNGISSILPFIPSSSSSSFLLRGPNMAPHEHTVTSSSSSSSSSSSYPYNQVSLSQQSISLTDILQ
ncbi:uncharacterized protein [Embiotoca jacksoni]|uniref:uncharacterized protein isoform X2 n=1 Tax=Embiotoca jacksoni TaxID=100190 RepID=UPI0037043053